MLPQQDYENLTLQLLVTLLFMLLVENIGITGSSYHPILPR